MLKYKAPLQIFIILEKVNIQVWTSKSNLPNTFFLLIPQKWFFTLNNIFKFELNFWNSYLVDMSAVDCSNYKDSNVFNSIFSFKNKLIVFYLYYFFFLKVKLKVLFFFNFFKKNNVVSIENLFNNANWIEREASEMFGVNYLFKKDVRKLLMDYSTVENPLLKNYPSSGYSDVFYNFFEDQVCLNINSSNEL